VTSTFPLAIRATVSAGGPAAAAPFTGAGDAPFEPDACCEQADDSMAAVQDTARTAGIIRHLSI
jgi:hypothetical protein